MITKVEDSRTRMLSVNTAQAAFYDRVYASPEHSEEAVAAERANLGSAVWKALKTRAGRAKTLAGNGDLHDRLIRAWVGSVAGKRVLDLGPGTGHEFCYEMARDASDYLAIDLSEKGIGEIKSKMTERGITKARTLAIDFLSPQFPEKNFDIVHARSVLHHFADPAVLAARLYEVTAPNGIVVSIDPLNTGVATRVARTLFQPFQTDSEWEWPLTRQSIATLERYFHIERIQGITGLAKWAVPISMVSQDLGKRAYRRMARYDAQHADRKGRALWSCIHVCMMLRRRNERP